MSARTRSQSCHRLSVCDGCPMQPRTLMRVRTHRRAFGEKVRADQTPRVPGRRPLESISRRAGFCSGCHGRCSRPGWMSTRSPQCRSSSSSSPNPLVSINVTPAAAPGFPMCPVPSTSPVRRSSSSQTSSMSVVFRSEMSNSVEAHGRPGGLGAVHRPRVWFSAAR